MTFTFMLTLDSEVGVVRLGYGPDDRVVVFRFRAETIDVFSTPNVAGLGLTQPSINGYGGAHSSGCNGRYVMVTTQPI
jgi:hypothetical protein